MGLAFQEQRALDAGGARPPTPRTAGSVPELPELPEIARARAISGNSGNSGTAMRAGGRVSRLPGICHGIVSPEFVSGSFLHPVNELWCRKAFGRLRLG